MRRKPMAISMLFLVFLAVLGFGAQAAYADLFTRGQQIFRFETFRDENFWGRTLRLHKAIAGVNNGGLGPGLSPNAALALGLKVDLDALPLDLIQLLQLGLVDLNDPAVTLQLLRLNAVVGVKGFFNPLGTIVSVGIQCALCHSTVDDALAPGIGRRRDLWANRDLNVGAIIALAPNLKPFVKLLGVDVNTVKAVLNSWGPGKFDAELTLDGKAFRPDGKSAATLIPPAFGLAGVNLHTWTGWGAAPHWNAFVAVLEMHGEGRFFDPRLNDPVKFPIAAANGFANVRHANDAVTSKLAPLHFFQLSTPAPNPPPGSFDPAAAERGEVLFREKGRCTRCHVPPLYTEPGWNMHTGAEIGIDDFQANRSPDGRYRTPPLKGLFTHTKGGFFHDGRFSSLMEVINHFNRVRHLGLTLEEKRQIVQFLMSI